MKKFAFPLALIIAAGGLIALFVVGNKHSSPSSPTKSATTKNWADNLPGLQKGKLPWSANQKDLKARLAAIGLEPLGTEGQALHIHQHLDIYVDGQKVEVPAQVGISESENFISHIHTHDTSGIIHVESPTIEDFTLGQFFTIWGVDLNINCVGGYCTTDQAKMKIFINGKQLTSDPRNLKLEAHQEIVIAYGTDAQLPNPIPDKFSFPKGL